MRCMYLWFAGGVSKRTRCWSFILSRRTVSAHLIRPSCATVVGTNRGRKLDTSVFFWCADPSGRWLAGIAGSNPAGVMDVCYECCVLSGSGLCRADHWSRGVLPRAVCLTECDREASIMRRLWPTRGCCFMKKSSWCASTRLYDVITQNAT